MSPGSPPLTPSPSPEQVRVGKLRHGRIHSHQPPPTPARGHPAVTQEGGKELAGSWHSGPARLVQPAQLLRAVASGTRPGAPRQMRTHGSGSGTQRGLETAQGDPRAVPLLGRMGQLHPPSPSSCRNTQMCAHVWGHLRLCHVPLTLLECPNSPCLPTPTPDTIASRLPKIYFKNKK